MLGIFLPYLQLTTAASKRVRSIQRALPHVVDLMVLGLGAGLDFTGAVRQVVDKAGRDDEPLIEELRLLLQEFKLPHTDSVIYDDRLDDHFHFLDEDSGELVDIPLADLPLDKTELARHLGAGFQIRDMHVLFRGRRAG